MQNSIFIAQESSGYLGFKKTYSLRKNDCFFAFCAYKNVSKKKSFLHIILNHNDYHHRKTTCTIFNIEKKRNLDIYIIKKRYTLQKKRQFAIRFYLQKAGHFPLRNFHEIFDKGICIQKLDTLRYVTFLYTKSPTLRKKQDNLRHVFLYTKSPTLYVTRFFMEFLKLAEGGGIFINKKQCTLRYFFIYKK